MKKLVVVLCLLFALGSMGTAVGSEWFVEVAVGPVGGGTQDNLLLGASDMDPGDPIWWPDPNAKYIVVSPADFELKKVMFLPPDPPANYPGGEKIWPVWISGLSGATQDIRVTWSTLSGGPTPGDAIGPGEWFEIRWANTKEVLWSSATPPSTHSTMFADFTLPLVISPSTYEGFAMNAHHLEFVHAVPEPGSMLVLGSGLLGILGIVRRRR